MNPRFLHLRTLPSLASLRASAPPLFPREMETRKGGRAPPRELRESSAYKSADFSIVENSSQSMMGSSKAERLRDISITISYYLFF